LYFKILIFTKSSDFFEKTKFEIFQKIKEKEKRRKKYLMGRGLASLVRAVRGVPFSRRQRAA
jgi:hypothetical protein